MLHDDCMTSSPYLGSGNRRNYLGNNYLRLDFLNWRGFQVTVYFCKDFCISQMALPICADLE
jgi:hypothetical protein